MSVLVVLEAENHGWNSRSFEALGAGLEIAEAYGLGMDAAVIEGAQSERARQIARYQVSTVYSLQHPLLRDYTPEGYTNALEALIRRCSPTVVVFPHTYQVRDYAPKLAARFGSALISDVIGIKRQGETTLFVRQMFLGKLLAEVRAVGTPVFVSVQANAFRAAEPANADANIEAVSIALEPAQISSRPEPAICGLQGSADVSGAKTIVSVGRGVREKADFALAESLAQVLEAELAGSRPVCDEGWLSMDRLVGSSGQTVSPNMYVAIGISGAIQHLLGMKGAKTIVAINRDATAPIFESAHYGIVGDLRVVVPALIEELRKTKS